MSTSLFFTNQYMFRNVHGLPLILSNGFPASVHSLSEAQLECFIKYLWEVAKIPKNSRFLPPQTINPRTRIENLKIVIRNVYARLNCKYLLEASEKIAMTLHRKNLCYTSADDNMNFVNLYEQRTRRLIIRIPRSNLDYDSNLPAKDKHRPVQYMNYRPAKHKNLKTEVEIISIDDSDEDCSSSNSTKPPIVSLSTSSDDDVICISDTEEPNVSIFNHKKHISPSKVSPIRLPPQRRKSKTLRLMNDNKSIILMPNVLSSEQQLKADTGMPRIEFTVSIPTDMSTELAYIVSDSDSDSPSENSPEEDPLRLNNNHKLINPSRAFGEAFRKVDVRPPKNKLEVRIRESKPKRGSTRNQSKKVSVLVENVETERQTPRRQKKLLNDIKPKKSPEKVIPGKLELDKIRPEDPNWNKKSVFTKTEFMNAMGLFKDADSANDVIMLPTYEPKDFSKYNRLPLMHIPFLAEKQLLKSGCLVPGGPGQNSVYTSTENIDIRDLRRRSYRAAGVSLSSRRMFDISNARDYKFPKKTFCTRTPVPMPAALRRRNDKSKLLRTKRKKLINGVKNSKIPPSVKKVTILNQGDAPELKDCSVVVERLDDFFVFEYFNSRCL